jgi:Na+/H+ antiporter NhaD/arsenite permease-like protein
VLTCATGGTLGAFIPIVVLLVVFILIAVRKIGRVSLRIWQVMAMGALAVLVTGQITPRDALASINPDVMLFLFGMFVIGVALAESGYLYHLSYRLFSRARSVEDLVFLVLVGMGMLSALLMNDTLAVVGTPLMLYFARRYGISEKLLLLALAFAVTTGSVASPIGNPQNLLIALSGEVENPFVTFLVFLIVPTVISLMLAYLFLRRAFLEEFHAAPLVHRQEEILDPTLAALARLSLLLLVLLIAFKVVLVLFAPDIDLRLTYIALIAALPVLIGSRRRLQILRGIDWQTLVFFAGLFILMASVGQSGVFQLLVAAAPADLASIPVIVAASVVFSQFVSNVPFVALYLPILSVQGGTTAGLMALAAGSTIAGNMLILGAASNVIIIQNAEKNGATLTFWEFARIGVPLAVIQAAVYIVFLILLAI